MQSVQRRVKAAYALIQVDGRSKKLSLLFLSSSSSEAAGTAIEGEDDGLTTDISKHHS